MIKNSLFSSLIIIICLSCIGRNTTTEINDLESLAINDYLSDIEGYLYEDTYERLYKIVVDIDGDKVNDVLISGYYKGSWGNSGGEWTVYLNKAKGFKKCDSKIGLYPSASRYDSLTSSILTYSRMGCCDGSLMWQSLEDCQIILDNLVTYENDNEIDEKIQSIFKDFTEFETYSTIINNSKELKWEIWK